MRYRVTDKQTNRQTDKQTDRPNYSNPRCACAPRVNYDNNVVAVFTGYLNISNDISFSLNTNLNDSNVEFTLNYTTSGGPATNVTCQTDHTLLPLESSVLVNAITAEYIHTLKVTGRKGGLFTSTVMNNKPSSISTSLLVKGKKCSFIGIHNPIHLLFQRLAHQEM